MRAIMRRVFVICSCVFALRQDAFNLGEKGHSSFTEMVFCCFSHLGLTARQEPDAPIFRACSDITKNEWRKNG